MSSAEVSNVYEVRAAAIIEEADALIQALKTIGAENPQKIRNELTVVRGRLFALVMEKHGGDQDSAALSDDFDTEFGAITAAIQLPKKQTGRAFSRTRSIGTGENGRSFIGTK